MPATNRITKEDVQAEIARLGEVTGQYPSLTILTEQAPPDDFDPQRIGLVQLPGRREN